MYWCCSSRWNRYANAGKAIENLFIDLTTNDQIPGIKFYNDNKEAIYVAVNTELPVKNKSYSEEKKTSFGGNFETYTVTDKDPMAQQDNLSAANLTIDGAFANNGVAYASGFGN